MARGGSYGGTTGSTLKVTISETIKINDRDYGSKQSFTIPAIDNIDRRIMKITNTESTILTIVVLISQYCSFFSSEFETL